MLHCNIGAARAYSRAKRVGPFPALYKAHDRFA
jgi:hypothetical protein